MSEKRADGAWLKIGLYRTSTLAKLSKDADWCWYKIQTFCAEDDNQGRLPKRDVVVALQRKVTPKVADKLMAELAEHDLAIDRGDWWELPRFSDENPPADTWHDPVKRERWARDKRLKRDGELCRRIKERDRNLCRYCGTRVNWDDKNGPHGGTYDHHDPDGDNSFSNVVVACRRCNGAKRDRTPEQWIADSPLEGRTLKKPGTTVDQAEAIDQDHRNGAPRAGPRPALVQPTANPSLARPHETGPGQPGASRPDPNPTGPNHRAPTQPEHTREAS